jgi:Sec-independent protein translocase protein TatA
MTWVIWLVAIFLFFGGANMVVRLVEGRRKFLLDLKKQEAEIAAARAQERELEHKQAELEQRRQELEYRKALLELEQFDRRAGLPGRLPAELHPDAPAVHNGADLTPQPSPEDQPSDREEPDPTT